MGEDVSVARNAFQQTMLGLAFDVGDNRPDLFSQACVEQYEAMDLTRFGYLFAQVFEDGVLHEVAVLAGIDYRDLVSLEHQPTAALTTLAELASRAEDLPVVGCLNVAAAAISISRFSVAEQLLAQAAARAADPVEAFEIAMLDFVITNRRDDGADSSHAFARMRQAITSGRLAPDRVMDAAAQAVVWYLKRKEIPAEEFAWFLRQGDRLAAADGMDPGALSSWYRARAMVPAAKRDGPETRRYMERAHQTARETLARRPRAYEAHFLKTYYESALKEHVYVTKDREEAVQAGRALIGLDPAWSPSYAELAEVFERFGDVGRAAALYEKAAEIGPPYVAHHLLQAARCRAANGDDDLAVVHYRRLALLAPESRRIQRLTADAAARRAAKRSRLRPVALDRSRTQET